MASSALDKRPHRDRCPGILALHEAADGWLARVRVPGGRLSAPQLRALAAAADELGSGLVDVTVRANVQLRGLEPAAGAALAERLHAAGLLPSPTHDRARNVLASPLAGRSRGALDPIDEVVALLDKRICASAALGELPGRFCFLVDDGTGACMDARPDVTVAARGGGRFGVTLGERPLAFEDDAEAAAAIAVQAAEAFLELRRGGRQWRLAETAGGPEAVSGRLGLPLDAVPARSAAAAAPAPGVELQRDGGAAVTALAPLAQLWPALLRELAQLCEEAATDVRLSTRRTVTLVDLHPGAAAATSTAMEAAGLEVDGASGWAGLTACAGVGACRKARADVRAAAAARARVRGAGAPREHWAACERRCGETRGTAVAVTVEGPGRVAIRRGRGTFTAATLEAASAALVETSA